MNTSEQDWQQFFWTGFYDTLWHNRITPEKTQEEVEGVLQLLKPAPDSHILDWCGGWGRHAISLAKRGFRITLLDFAPNHIQAAKEAAEQADVQLNLICADFRETPPEIQADYAVNLFTAGIGYLGREQDLVALKSLHQALKPGARFLLDTINMFWIVKNYNPSSGHFSENGIAMLSVDQRTFDFWTNNILSEHVLWAEDGKGLRKKQVSHTIYCAADLILMLQQAGFEVLELYGGFGGQPYGFDTRRLIIVSQRV